MDFQVRVTLVLKSGVTKVIEWIENNPRLIQKNKDTGETVREIPLSKDELKREVSRRLVNEKKPFMMEGIDGKIYSVNLNEVAYLTVDAKDYVKQPELVGSMVEKCGTKH